VRDRAIARSHRIHDDDLRAALLQRAEPELDRIRVVILGDAPEHQVLRQRPVRLAELPEAAAERVHAGRGHVDRAEAAVCGVVDRAERLRPPAGQRLGLVAAGEERELVRIAVADVAEPFRRELERLVPFDFAELALAALADAQQRLRKPRRRVVLHDAGRTLRADHAAVDRMLRVAVDVADAAVLEMHADAAAAGAHVAGRGLDAVAGRLVEIEVGVRHGWTASGILHNGTGWLYHGRVGDRGGSSWTLPYRMRRPLRRSRRSSLPSCSPCWSTPCRWSACCISNGRRSTC